MSGQMDGLTDRIGRLERERRVWRTAVILLALTGGAGFILGANLTPAPDMKASKITASSVVLVDEDGNKRAEFSYAGGETRLRFMEEDGRETIRISGSLSGAEIVATDVGMYDSVTIRAATSNQNLEEPQGDASVSIHADKRAESLLPAVRIGLDGSNRGEITFRDTKGRMTTYPPQAKSARPAPPRNPPSVPE